MLIFNTPIVWPTSTSWVLLMMAISLCGFGTQLFLTTGLQREAASRGSLGTYTQIIFAEMLDRIIFHSKLSVLGLVGTGIILTSALYVAVSDYHRAPTMWAHDCGTVDEEPKGAWRGDLPYNAWRVARASIR
jgi:drug/metabolite transporter (DMT)-like permease